jgi:hypothetical protein
LQDRRGSPRKPLVAEVEYETAGVRAKARINNVGTLGVFIEEESRLPVGARLKLRFRLPDDHTIEAEGVVAHRQTGVGMGVAFVTIGAEAVRRIRDFIEADGP